MSRPARSVQHCRRLQQDLRKGPKLETSAFLRRQRNESYNDADSSRAGCGLTACFLSGAPGVHRCQTAIEGDLKRRRNGSKTQRRQGAARCTCSSMQAIIKASNGKILTQRSQGRRGPQSYSMHVDCHRHPGAEFEVGQIRHHWMRVNTDRRENTTDGLVQLQLQTTCSSWNR